MDAPVSLVLLDEVTSTNDHAAELAAQGAPEGTLVVAERQTRGRGRRARPWVSQSGNLFASIVVRPRVPPGRAAEIGFIAAVAVAETVAEMLPGAAAVRVKWPNDVLVNDRKAAGLLLEAAPATAAGTVESLVVGVGVNLRHHPPDALYPATSVAEEGGEPRSAEVAAGMLYGHFARGLAVWRNAGFAPVRAAWLARAAGLGERVTVRLDSETLTGVFKDLDSDGALVLSQGTGSRRIVAGDVFPAR